MMHAAAAGAARADAGSVDGGDAGDGAADVADAGATNAPSVDEGSFRAAVVPRFTLSSDDGFGAGARGVVYRHRFGQKPYKTAIAFQVFATTRLVQHHFLRVDAIDAFNVPLRIVAELGYAQTLTFNDCAGDCDAASARAAAIAQGYVGAAQNDVARRYWLVRFLRPYASAVVRWRLDDLLHGVGDAAGGRRPPRPELFAGWRGDLYVPGDLGDEDGDGAFDLFPYPGSRYATRFPVGEPGFASVFLVGASLDGRDEEPDPTRGFFVEASARGAAFFVGSAWDFAGANTTASVFAPLLPARRLVLASRVVVDGLVGDPPTYELAQTGGSAPTYALGGADLGRGVRQQRFYGRHKLVLQHELRSTLASFTVVQQDFRVGAAVFLDAGAAAGGAAPLDDDDAVAWGLGCGAGLRVVWNDAFVMRVDVAFSPVERWTPLIYTKPDHPF